MKGQVFKERRASGTRLYKTTRQYVHGKLVRKAKYCKKKAQMLAPMSKCPDSGVVGGFGSGT